MLPAEPDGAEPRGSLAAALAVMGLPGVEQAIAMKRGVLGALDVDDAGLTGVQQAIVDALSARFVVGDVPPVADLEPAGPGEVAELVTRAAGRRLLAHVCVLLELCDHPVRPEVERSVESYVSELGVRLPELTIARDTARNHLVRLHADLLRNSWYTEQTVVGAATGRLWEYARSKVAYYGVVGDGAVARRWHSLRDHEPGTWGRTVADFYAAHGFPFPGERHGIYEVGALHDWVHVLADYSTDPEGEIDVFAFIAATMDDPKGFVQFVFTLALFQNASIDEVGGLKVAIARGDTLSDDGATDRLADALWRASRCTADPMGGVDHFALAGESLVGLRERWSVIGKGVPSPGALEVHAPAEGSGA